MLPSKKIWVALVLLVVGIVALGWYRFGRNSNIVLSNKTSGGLSAITSPLGTGVGTANIGGPSDYSSNTSGDTSSDTSTNVDSQGNPTSNSAATTQSLTATDVLARDLFTQIVKLKQAGVTVDSNNAPQIVDDYLKTAPLPTINAVQYSANDITIVDSNPTTLLKYQTEITAVFAKYWPTGANNEMVILHNAFTGDDSKILNQLTGVISSYESLLNNSLILAVPKTAVGKHLAVMNSLSAYIQTLKMIQLEYTDPVSGTVGLNAFMQNQTNLRTNVYNLRIFLINNVK